MSVQMSSPTRTFAIVLFIDDRDQTFESHASAERVRSRFVLSPSPLRIQPAPPYAPLDSDYGTMDYDHAIFVLPTRSPASDIFNQSDLNSARSRSAGSSAVTVTLYSGLHRLRIRRHLWDLQFQPEDHLLHESEDSLVLQ
ncbi:hypothetical protein BD626DRAFT_576201 [Schizophyllum amplum]|uniref:Uncharacterized protein n=1 Tax=Schizophyllum amplum TaxID=97359 RepID=A0A550BU39_9AGAR|nr:hypothetical protein BD626DRAFT_576201 [Auriculariopsis ampla]